jgi:uncharacterized protein
VKVPDVNLLISRSTIRRGHHEPARRWLEERLSGTETFAFAWAVLVAFVRLTTNPRVFERPFEPSEALDLVDSWLAQPCATIAEPTGRHAALLRELLATSGAAGNLVSDAHLAAIAIEHGAELCSADADSSRFPRLLWRDPLADGARPGRR